jgi:polysaccharide pyruvyl transferase WcaK-like protein
VLIKKMNNQRPPKIGLLTPYTGKNLGDGAIQEAVIANIRLRYPNAIIHGLTIDPAATEKLLNIPCSAITSLSIRNYCKPTPVASTGGQALNIVTPGYLKRIKDFIKRIPFIFPTWQFIRQMTVKLSSLIAEFGLVKRGYTMLREFDLLIVSGGGQLDDYWGGAWGHPFTLLKWGLVARVAGVRYVFLSVGTCTLKSPLSAMFTKWALRLASYRSYRDTASKQLLQHLAFTRNDAVYPDLAFSHDIPVKNETTSTINRRPVVGISPIAYLSSYYWPEQDLSVYDSYIKNLIAFVASLLKDDISVVLFHTSGTDKFVVKEILETFHNDTSINEAGSITAIITDTVEDLLSLMANFDFVVASRLHGVILAHLMNRPVLAISYDRKVMTHMEDVEQSEYCIDIHNFKLESLVEKFSTLMSQTHLCRSIIFSKASEFKSRLDLQYDQIFRQLL